MCKAPKPPPVKEPEKPEFLHNPFLDAAIGQSGVVDQLRTGRSSLRIDLDSGLGIRQPSTPPGPSSPPLTTPIGALPRVPRRVPFGQSNRRLQIR